MLLFWIVLESLSAPALDVLIVVPPAKTPNKVPFVAVTVRPSGSGFLPCHWLHQGRHLSFPYIQPLKSPGWRRRSRTRRSSLCTAAAAKTAPSRAFSRCPGFPTSGRRRRTAGWRTRRTSPRIWCSAPASPRPQWMSLSHSTFRDLGAQPLIGLLVGHLGLPLMVKPQHGGSALGATAVRTAEDLPAALVERLRLRRDRGGRAVRRRRRDWRSPCWRTRTASTALPAVEISPTSGIFDYESRYTAGLTTYFTPARLTDEVAAAAAELAIGAHRALGLRDLSRTDAIATAGRRRALPGGQCLAGAHRDLDAADVRRRGRSRPRRGVRRDGGAGDRPRRSELGEPADADARAAVRSVQTIVARRRLVPARSPADCVTVTFRPG